MKLSNTLYDILNKLQRWLPAVGTFYLALCQIWDLPLGTEVNQTVVAIATFLATILEISTSNYHKDKLEEQIVVDENKELG